MVKPSPRSPVLHGPQKVGRQPVREAENAKKRRSPLFCKTKPIKLLTVPFGPPPASGSSNGDEAELQRFAGFDKIETSI